MISLGIDHGNYNTKSSDGLIYPSGYQASAVRPITDGEALLLQYDGTFYSIGARRFAVQYDKSADDNAFILTLPALGHAIQTRSAHLRSEAFILGVGLPLAAYSKQKDAFRDYFLRRNIRFTWRDQEYCADILDARVYPQGYAAYLTAFNDLARYNSVSFLDIGGYTIDVFRTDRGRLQAGSTTSLQTGTIIMLRRMLDELARLDIILSEQQLIRAVTGSPIDHQRKDNALGIIRQVKAEYVRDLGNTLREQGIDAQTPIVLIGGGAELLEKELRDRMFVVGTLDKYANARGYKLWLDRDFKI